MKVKHQARHRAETDDSGASDGSGTASGAASVVTDASTFINNTDNDFWTALNLGGQSLDVMRFNIADNASLAADETAKDNGTFVEVERWANANGWRFATKEELELIAGFFNGDVDTFKAFNGDTWGLKEGAGWTGLVPTEAQNDGDANPSWGFTVKDGSFGNVAYKKNFNSSALGAAAVLVRLTPVAVGG